MQIDNWKYSPAGFGKNGPSYILKPLNRKSRIAARIALDNNDAYMLADLADKFELIFVDSSENTEKLTEQQKESITQMIFFELINKAFLTVEDKKKSS